MKLESRGFLHEKEWTTRGGHAYYEGVPQEGIQSVETQWSLALVPGTYWYSFALTIMPDIFAAPTVQAGLAITVLLVMIVGAIWLLGRLRDYNTQDRPAPQEGFVNLEEMLRKGDISEAEFRNIKASAHSHVVLSTSAQSQPVRSPEPPSDSSDE